MGFSSASQYLILIRLGGCIVLEFPKWTFCRTDKIYQTTAERNAPARNRLHTLERQADQLRVAGIAPCRRPISRWARPISRASRLPERFVLLVPGGARTSAGEALAGGALRGARRAIARGARDAGGGRRRGRGPLGAAIRAACPAARDLTGETELRRSGGAGRRALRAVGNDTGPMHLLVAGGRAGDGALFREPPIPRSPRRAGPQVTDPAAARSRRLLGWRRLPPRSPSAKSSASHATSQDRPSCRPMPRPAVTLPDGSVRSFPARSPAPSSRRRSDPASPRRRSRSRSTARRRDLAAVDRPRRQGRDRHPRRSPEALEILRHDAAHVMAEAVKELYPDDPGHLRPGDRDRLLLRFRPRHAVHARGSRRRSRQRMREIVDRDEPITREVWERDEAVALLPGDRRELQGRMDRTRSRKDEEISLYRQGDFVDLCAGPHLPSTGKLGQAFKLMKVAGAYWRGDAQERAAAAHLRHRLGRARRSSTQYLFQLEEAEKRDHRRLGRELDLFHQQEEAVGSVFWHPKGWTLYRTIENYMRRRLEAAGYRRGARRRSCSTARCGKPRAIGRSSASNMFIADEPTTSACSRSSR